MTRSMLDDMNNMNGFVAGWGRWCGWAVGLRFALELDCCPSRV